VSTSIRPARPPKSDRSPTNVVFWFRRDLRIADNPALLAAIAEANRTGGSVLAVFILDLKLGSASGTNRLAFLYGALQSLTESGVPLVLRHGDPATEIPALAASVQATAVYCASDFGPYGRKRDDAVSVGLQVDGRELRSVGSSYVIEPGTVRKGDNTPFKVFTPFKRVWTPMAETQSPNPTVDAATVSWCTDIDGEAIPERPQDASKALPPATEAAALERLHYFLETNMSAYDNQRNIPALDATSRLSADLKFGLLHPRQILPSLRVGGTGAEVFKSELCWREFYADVLFQHPHSASRSLNASMEAMQTDHGPIAEERFARWCAGTTGFPFIDAGMRQLRVEGWMHNRVRMAVASFLVKDLHLPWQRGAKWFMEHLVDGDLASNAHGWQWTAGTGTDASPYYRVFNPITQGKKFDPDGIYVRRFVPELGGLANKEIHEPWLVGGGLFGGVEGYPEPIVDHAAERIESLRRLGALKESSGIDQGGESDQ
jgi:deoxyribodipyrimidine photo-lyase